MITFPFSFIRETTEPTPPIGGLVLNLDAASYIGSGNWLDTSGNNNNGTLVQTPTYSTDDGGFFVLDGGPISAIGQVDSFSISNNDTLDIMSEISIEMWININSIEGTSPNMIFSKRGDNTNGYVGFFTNSQFLFRVGTGSPSQVSWVTTPSTSVWQQIAVTVGFNGSKIYQNGIELASSTYAGNFTNINTSANLLIGDQNPVNSGLQGFNGKISIFRIYSNVLSSSEVLSNFDNIKSRYGL
jgi:hypothetical protein